MDVRAHARWIDPEFASGEVADAADRLSTLSTIYEELDAVPIESLEGRNDCVDVFQRRPSPPDDAADPHNARLQRFELKRRGTTDDLADLTSQ